MDVAKAIEQGRCSLAVSGALLRDPEIMLALTDRGALNPMALSGPAVSPVQPVGETGAARAMASKDGVLVLVEPERVDQVGLDSLGKLLARAPHKPTVVVVSRNFNPFAFGTALRGLKVEHEKGKGKAFIKGLPTPPQDAVVPDLPKAVKAKKGSDAPKFAFVGRDEEVEALAAILTEPGPVVLSGPTGVGRTQLAEHAIAKAGLQRLPEITLTWDVGFDSLLARIAVLTSEAGSTALADRIAAKDHTPKQLVDAAIEALNAADVGGKAMLVHDLEFALGPESDFFRRSRLELLVEALLTNTTPLRLIFTSSRQPTFYREGQAAALRRVEVQGLKGRFLHELFEACKAPEFKRDRFGPISEKLHGHVSAARLYAMALRDADDHEKLLDDEKFFKMKTLDDTAGLGKRVEKALGRLSKSLRGHLALLSHTRLSLDGGQISDLNISRKDRMALLASGLLDTVGTLEEKRYRVGDLVRGGMTWRETHDFGFAEELAEAFRGWSEKTDKLTALAYKQEANRLLVSARKNRSRLGMPAPDFDPVLESTIGLIRSKQPRFDMASQRLREVINRQPANSDAWLLLAEVEKRAESKGNEVVEIFDEAAAKAPVPEIFHRAAGYWLGRRKRPKAIELLEQAVTILPDEPRLHTRLASLLLSQGRRPEGLAHLDRAMELAPMLPDAYGLKGQAKRAEGLIDDAEVLLREAARLGADDPVQVARLVDLLMARARVDLERQDALREEARELLDATIGGQRDAADAYLLLATLVRETTGDLERAAWLLKKARKNTERGTDRHRRIQIESAIQNMAAGKLDEAENDLRERCARDPSDHRVFAALAHVLEAREMYVPAHAEYLRAKERAPKGSLSAQLYDLHLKRMQAVIEAQAAGLLAGARPAEEAPIQGPSGHQRVIRRKKGEESAEVEAQATAEAAPDADEAPASEQDGDEPSRDDGGADDLDDLLGDAPVGDGGDSEADSDEQSDAG